MAKKSKIARNEQRKVIVERYAEKRLALKRPWLTPMAVMNRAMQHAWDFRSSPVTLHRCAFVAVTQSMAALVVS